MTLPDPPPDPPWGNDADARAFAQDWITVWQSELAAVACDREMQEGWQTMLALWARSATAAFSATPAHDHAASRPAAPPRSPPAAAAPDARDAEIRRLADRVAALEERLSGRDPGP